MLREDSPPYHVNVNGSHNKLRFIDLFCGIGGFRFAFERAGCECVFSSDWNEKAQETYAANFGENDFQNMSPLTGLEFLLGWDFYRGAAPVALGFSIGKSSHDGNEETPGRVRPVYLANESACSRMEQNSVRA